MAFNLLPGPEEGELVAEQLRALFSSPPRIGITTLQASVFHGLSVSIFCRLDPDTSAETVRELLEEQPHLEFGDGSLDVGPIAATALDKVLVGEVKPAAQVPGGVWIWAVLDNLTRGPPRTPSRLPAPCSAAEIQRPPLGALRWPSRRSCGATGSPRRR